MRQATQAVARVIIWQRRGTRLNCTSEGESRRDAVCLPPQKGMES
jgi:hypothetical protein